MRVRENIHGQIFDMGKFYPQVIRENVLDLYNAGLLQREISVDARVSLGFVNKIIKEYDQNNLSMSRKVFSGCHKSVMCEDVRDYLENEKLNKPSIYTHELQARLLLDGVCFPHDIPSTTSVNRFLNEELRMSQKRIMQVPSESLTGPNIDSQNEFLDEVSRIEPCTLHDVLSLENPDGSIALERGDTVIMGNCGFHHGRFAEGMLRDMFEEFRVHLLYQLPYCPHLNTCELCFHQMKSFLCRFSRFALEETRIAIAEGIAQITQLNSIAYFWHCGYLM